MLYPHLSYIIPLYLKENILLDVEVTWNILRRSTAPTKKISCDFQVK